LSISPIGAMADPNRARGALDPDRIPTGPHATWGTYVLIDIQYIKHVELGFLLSNYCVYIMI